METKYIMLHNVPFKFLNFRGQAANLRIGESRQLVWIPRKYFNNDGTLKENVNLDWWFYKWQTQHKIKLFKEEKQCNQEK